MSTRDTTAVQSLLRPEQVEANKDEIRRLEAAIQHPLAQDKPLMARQVRALKAQLEELTPKPFATAEIDAAAAEEAHLREEMIADGMPTQAEMRRNPAGGGLLSSAVHKHRTWEARNKTKLQRWKYLRQRLYAEANDPNIANFEQFRPATASHELNMDTAQIEGKHIHLPPRGADLPVTFSDDELDTLGEISAALRDAVGTMNNTQRAEVLAFVRKITEENLNPKTMEPKRKPRVKRERTPEQVERDRVRMAAIRAKRKVEQKTGPAGEIVSPEPSLPVPVVYAEPLIVSSPATIVETIRGDLGPGDPMPALETVS